jgi:ribosomal protein L12E/L44/L45/RPP1/RPP2
VTANDITSGALQAWINELTINYPCPQATLIVQQTVTNAVQQAVAAATSAATATATSAATSAAASAATPAAETKSESKSEEKSEKKSDSKAKPASSNPIIYSSDFTVAPTSEVVSIIASVGMSQASMMGNSSWGINSMIWSTFDQFAIGGRYTLMNYNEGKLESISNFGVTGVYLGGNVLGFATGAYIFPMGKYGTTGANYTFSVAGAMDELNLSNNILLFYTVPIKINKYVSISPDIYVSGSSTGYLTKQETFVTSNDIGFLTGASFDIAITKRFKFNFALKTGFNTNPIIPQSYLGMIGTKINL